MALEGFNDAKVNVATTNVRSGKVPEWSILFCLILRKKMICVTAFPRAENQP